MDWIRHLWDQSRQRAAEAGFELPDFETFWEQETFELPDPARPTILLEDFRTDPEATQLSTQYGQLEIFSETVTGFGYDDCPRNTVCGAHDEGLCAPPPERVPPHPK